LPGALTGHVIWRIPTVARVVALTFDGGSGAQGVAPVLAALHATGVPATFFLTGQFVQTNAQAVRAIAASAVIGDHTMTHPHLTQLSWSAVRAEVSGAESVISGTIGRAAKPWFRFPFGESDARTLGIVNGLGYAAIGWTIDTRGWQGRAGAGTVHDIVARVMAKLEPGAIVLMHLGAAPDGSTLDADSLQSVIAAIRGAGYSFVTVNALR
jgi:peptidoglycan/xylan/chitin deacetylase (PgdA/CDA1 family)